MTLSGWLGWVKTNVSVALAAGQHVAPLTAAKHVVAGVAEELVATPAAGDEVVARAAMDRVGAGSAREVVVAVVAEDRVGAAGAADRVVAAEARQCVVAGEPENLVALPGRKRLAGNGRRGVDDVRPGGADDGDAGRHGRRCRGQHHVVAVAAGVADGEPGGAGLERRALCEPGKGAGDGIGAVIGDDGEARCRPKARIRRAAAR